MVQTVHSRWLAGRLQTADNGGSQSDGPGVSGPKESGCKFG